MIKKMFFLLLGMFSLLLDFEGRCFAASTVAIMPSGENSFILQGSGVENAAAMDITISYDASTLGSPQVAQGALISGAMMAVNDTLPGIVRIGIIRLSPISGTGTIATLTFARKGAAAGTILALIAKFSNSGGQPLVVLAQVVKPADSAADNSGASGAQGGQTAGTTASTVIAGGSLQSAPLIIDAPARQPVPELKKEEAATADTAAPVFDAAGSSRTAAVAPDAQGTAAQEPPRGKVNQYVSVLEKFKAFKGKKTPQALMALFRAGEADGKQQPPIVLSDGKAMVTLIVELNSKGENNNLLLDGVSLVSMKNKEKNFWIVELLPEKNAVEASVSVPRNKQWQVMPLTVAPPLDVKRFKPAGTLTEADFTRYLEQRGTVNKPRFDLNADGKRNYVDDYIFTANYLIALKKVKSTK